jgi:hypothetical protein
MIPTKPQTRLRILPSILDAPSWASLPAPARAENPSCKARGPGWDGKEAGHKTQGKALQ